MKAEIHPEYGPTIVKCVCGNSWETRSTMGAELQVDICSACHPFYTGKQKLVDTAGRVERFRRRYEKVEKMKTEQKAKVEAEKEREAAAKVEPQPAAPAEKPRAEAPAPPPAAESAPAEAAPADASTEDK